MSKSLLFLAVPALLAACQAEDRESPPPPMLSDSALEWLGRDAAEDTPDWIVETVQLWRESGGRGEVPSEYAGPWGFDPEGDWATGGGLQGAEIHIRRAGDGTYSVLFSTSGCLDHWSLRRTATYENGVLTLDQPVTQYLPITYDQLFAVRSGGSDYLLPGEGEVFPSELPPNGIIGAFTSDMDRLGFVRYSERQVREFEQDLPERKCFIEQWDLMQQNHTEPLEDQEVSPDNDDG